MSWPEDGGLSHPYVPHAVIARNNATKVYAVNVYRAVPALIEVFWRFWPFR